MVKPCRLCVGRDDIVELYPGIHLGRQPVCWMPMYRARDCLYLCKPFARWNVLGLWREYCVKTSRALLAARPLGKLRQFFASFSSSFCLKRLAPSKYSINSDATACAKAGTFLRSAVKTVLSWRLTTSPALDT